MAQSQQPHTLWDDAASPFHSGDAAAAAPPLSASSFSSPVSRWQLDSFAQDPGYVAYREELRCLIFNTAQTAPSSPSAETRDQSPLTPNAVDQVERLAQRQTAELLARGRHLDYLKNYVAEVAPWLDMFDSQRAFGMQIPHLAQSSPALMYAVLALSARQKERQNALVPPSLAQAGLREQEAPPASFDSLELYQEAIRLITPLMQTHDPAVIPICVILCCLEMMSASAHDWRRHLEGCAALFDAFGLHGFSGGLMQAIFWCFARMDLCGALISDGTESTMVAPATWLPPGAHETDARSLFREAGSADMHANYAVYLCSKACELLSDRTQFLEMDEQNGCTTEVFASRWARLWHDLQVWLDQRPAEMLPVQTNDTKPFPQILYIHWAAISSNQLYHAACILLLSSMPRTTIKDPPRGLVGSTAWHAKQICGISLTNPHQGCLNNAIQPLWLAGRLLSHESEHAAVVELIQSIESETGWGACWRIPDLEAAWGYAASRYTRPPANKAWE